MKTAFLVLVLAVPAAAASKTDAPPESLYEMTAKGNNGREIPLSQYRGKVALVANTASKCGFTPQYKQLQALYDKYKDKGLVVLGFPSNDFLHQEPGTDTEIKKFCEINYGVTFPLFAKDHVKGSQTQPVFQFLKASDAGGKDGEIGWNFTKFLVDKDGHVAARFSSRVKPDSPEVIEKLEALLAAKPFKS